MKKELFHYGCSFTHNFKYFELEHYFEDNYNYHNHGKISANNKYILDKFKETSQPNSIAIIQWSSLTRPFDDNYEILKTSNNPLYDYLEEWYDLLEDAKQFAQKNNIKLLQFIGWAQWRDDELNDYHREKLNSFGIKWFESSRQWEIIASNCFQFQTPYEWSSNPRDLPDGEHFLWDHIHWGGMSEWIRSNLEIKDRYVGTVYDETENLTLFDPHPSKYATSQFVEKYLLLELNKL